MIDISKIQQLSATVEIDEVESGATAYGVWKIAKEVFATLGIEFGKVVDGKFVETTSQTFYNYAKNGKINGVKNSKGRFTDDEIEIFIAKLIASKTR